jgi:hypothetical protein
MGLLIINNLIILPSLKIIFSLSSLLGVYARNLRKILSYLSIIQQILPQIWKKYVNYKTLYLKLIIFQTAYSAVS